MKPNFHPLKVHLNKHYFGYACLFVLILQFTVDKTIDAAILTVYAGYRIGMFDAKNAKG